MLPQDPIILLSFVNTKLRDKYKSIEEFCCDFGVKKEIIDSKLESVGYEYVKDLNQYK